MDAKGKRSHDTAIMWTNYQKGQHAKKQASLGTRLVLEEQLGSNRNRHVVLAEV
jgi:hypothetical protein